MDAPVICCYSSLKWCRISFFYAASRRLEGRKFTVLKFRTINSKGTSNAIQSWMRKLGIDELPQLFNVLAGQMSLIGPRPHTEGDGFNYAAKSGNIKFVIGQNQVSLVWLKLVACVVEMQQRTKGF